MNNLREPLTSWSFGATDETALGAYTEELVKFAQECLKSPGEKSALIACRATRNIWDTAEGMIYENIPLNPEQLAKSIEGIRFGVDAVSQMDLTGMDSHKAGHVAQMIAAMKERHEDLTVLLNDGKMAFINRLRSSRRIVDRAPKEAPLGI